MYRTQLKQIANDTVVFFDNVISICRKYNDIYPSRHNIGDILKKELLINIYEMSASDISANLTNFFDSLENYRYKVSPKLTDEANALSRDCCVLMEAVNTYTSVLSPRLIADLDNEGTHMTTAVTAFIRGTEALRSTVISTFDI